MLLHPDCIFTIHIAMSLREILLKSVGELGAILCNSLERLKTELYF